MLILKYSSFLGRCSMCLPCVCLPAHVVLVLPRHNYLSGHARGMCHWLLSAVANLARNCGSCRALSSFMWFMLSKRCSTLHLVSLAAVCKETMYYIAGKKQPSLKTLQKVDGWWEELWGRSSVSRQREEALELLAVHSQCLWEELTFTLVLLVCFYHPV